MTTITDSLRHIFKHKSSVFTDTWKEDVATVLKEVAEDFTAMIHSRQDKLEHARRRKLSESVVDKLNSAKVGIHVLKILPGRISEGFSFFREDLLLELDNLDDHKEKRVFTLKVLGALTSYTVSTFYAVKMGKLDFNIRGVKQLNAFGRILAGEVVFRLMKVMLVRLLDELEKDVQSDQDLMSIRYLRELLGAKTSETEKVNDPHQDPAIEIVEKLKKYIMTGKRENE